MIAEIKTLFWLQWKLTIAMFRSRRAYIWARLGRILLMLLMLITTIPFFLGIAAALGYGLTRLSPQGAYELAILANCCMLFLWLLLPGTYSSEVIERFEMSRLFVHPISFRSLVTGSTLISLLSFAGVWTALVMAGELVGLAWHNLWAFPLIILGAIPTFVILVLIGRLMDDVFDLVSSDRRLKGLMVFIMSLPFMLIFALNYLVQYSSNNFENMPAFLDPLLQNMPSIEGLGFSEAADVILVNLRLSRFLIWLPTGWASAGMASAITGRWVQGLGFLAASGAFAGSLLWAHAAITRRMMRGAAIRIGTERVKSRRLNIKLPGPSTFWALFRKDWLYLMRGFVTKRILFATPIIIVAMGVGVWQATNVLDASHPIRQAIPIVAASILLVTVNLSTSNYTSNYFGTVDREGFATLMTSPIDRRYIWLSANLMTLILAMSQSLVLLTIVAIAARSWIVLPLGLYLGLCLHISTVPAYNLTSIIGPNRMKMGFSNQGGNMWVVLAWIVASPLVLALFLAPYFLWRPGLIITLPLAAIYSIGLYVGTLRPLVFCQF